MRQELIWELMKQAGELAYAEHKAKCLKEGLDPEHTVWSVTGAHYEKFAELIMAECIRKIEDIAESSDNPRPIYRVAVELLEHFGVQE